ncbi:Anaphase-promoting complex subunit 2 [Coemansia nantahalensis]|uniref:Anaphase-promoting complex subunit 2 n=1 Tax=Coemansia nantahalensis TaxID=2789366 RepID=A0ACC1K1J6_9FUNG|nr:Anaphase-promoting complex subunit 2 [Coemansia nantahalensis]
MYNICGALPDEALQAIVRQVKARDSAPAAGCRAQHGIDQLAAAYGARLRGLRQEAADSNRAPQALAWFPEHLSRVASLFDAFTGEAGATGGSALEPAVRLAWNALAYESFVVAGTGWLEEWVHQSLRCLLRVVEADPMGVLRADLGSLDDEAVAHLRSCCMGAGAQRPESAAATCDDELCRQVCSSEAETLRFLSGLARGCRLLADLSILDAARGAVLDAAAGVVRDAVAAHQMQWGACALASLAQNLGCAARVLDVLLANPPGQTLAAHVETQLYEQFSALRVGELFSIIVDYPDSRPAIDDLRDCVAKLGNMRHVAVSLRNAVQQRLLHPGATTSDILTQYISVIRCLRLLDPSSTMLEIVAQPIRGYLRSRDDTVSCIVQDMVSSESELFEDLESGPAALLDSTPEGIDYDEDCDSRDWQPLPVEAKSVYRTAQRRDADVLSLLVSIYDTRDVFVHEFEAHLAQRLLACAGFDTAREIRQVEMMKLRFGAPALERCEVMLKDMADSKRVNQGIAESGRASSCHQATVVSRQFWPASAAAQEQAVVLPPQMAAMRERFAAEFEALKPARKLEWRDAQALVTLRVQLEDRAIEVEVRPAQAATLFAFQDRPALTLAEVAQALECAEDFALPRLRFWQTRGVLRETRPGVFETVESEAGGSGATGPRDAPGGPPRGADSDEEPDDLGAAAGAPSGAGAEALRVHFNFIVAMLTNLGPLPLDRIHGMLGMFLPGDTTTAEELRDFLAQMVREDRLDVAGGLYKLK